MSHSEKSETSNILRKELEEEEEEEEESEAYLRQAGSGDGVEPTSPMEQPVPDLMKKLVTRGVDSLLEGMVRKQVHSLMQVAFHKVRMPHRFC